MDCTSFEAGKMAYISFAIIVWNNVIGEVEVLVRCGEKVDAFHWQKQNVGEHTDSCLLHPKLHINNNAK